MSEEHGNSQAGEREDGREGTAAAPRSIAEWTTLGISVLLLLGIVGLVSYLHLNGGEDPPVIVVEARLDDVRHTGDGYYVPVVVRNRGDRTAEDVRVQAELETGSGAPVTAEFAITFLAGGEVAQGTFIFGEDPAQGRLTVVPVSYQ